MRNQIDTAMKGLEINQQIAINEVLNKYEVKP
jgi:hypothetical protein